MPKIISQFLYLLLPTSFLISQENTITIQYYATTKDYLAKNLSNESVSAMVKRIGSEYIWVESMVNNETLKRSKAANQAWAIRYREDTYFNLRFSQNTAATGFYIKMDVEGKYCLAIMDPEFLSNFSRATLNYGGGLTGLLIHDSVTWGGNYPDKHGEKKKIFFINTNYTPVDPPFMGINAPGDLLAPNILKALLAKSSREEKKSSEYTVEEIVDLILELNEKNKVN